jgi:Fas apoptotic inhibitory molecule (FAIM1)
MSKNLSFHFTVGSAEPHLVKFSFDQTWGNLVISVDDEVVVKKFQMFSLKTTDEHAFSVGKIERHDVLIRKSRERWFGGFKPQACEAFIDGHPCAVEWDEA